MFDAGERALLLGAPARSSSRRTGSKPSLLVWLDRVEEGLLRELLIDAWRGRSAKRLVHQWEQRATRERLACRQPESSDGPGEGCSLGAPPVHRHQRLRQHPDALAPDGPDERDAATELPQALGTATARATVAAMDKPRISVPRHTHESA